MTTGCSKSQTLIDAGRMALASSPPPRPRILLVDDSPTQLAALVTLLQDHCEIQVATNGPQGLALAGAGPMDMILLDVQMPEMDGHAVARALQSDPATRDVPFIFLTVDDTGRAEHAGLELGATDYITKPVNGDVALRRILNHLERDRLRKQVEADRALLEDRVAARTAELERAKDEAQAANRLKDAILRNLSHELRTPLNGIVGLLTVLRGRLSDASALRYVTLAEQSAARLHETLISLLDLAQLQAGLLSLEPAPFGVAEVVDAVVEKLQPETANKGLTLAVSIDAACRPERCLGDRARVQQVLHELVRNAVKFSGPGRVEVQARVVERSVGPGHGEAEIQVSVSDEGPGVDPAQMQRIFEPFVQLDATMARAAEGNGVGLALSQGLARLMGGSIELASRAPTGSTFTLRLPWLRAVGP